MNNSEVMLALIQSFLNQNNEIEEDKFLEIISGLEEDEVNELIAVLKDNDITVSFESESSEACSSNGTDSLYKLSNEELCEMYQNGNKEALTALTVKNKAFIMHVARQVIREYGVSESLQPEDEWAAGFMGIKAAADKYSPDKGARYITYCGFWVRQSIARDVMESGFTMKIPTHIFEQIVKLSKARKALNGGTPEQLRDYINETYGKEYTTKHIKNIIFYADKYLSSASLNKTVGDEEDTEMGDMISSKYCLEDEVERKSLMEQVDKLLTEFGKENARNERAERVLRKRFGIGCPAETLEQIGVEEGITRERIRQIQVQTCYKFKRNHAWKALTDYLAA